MDELTKLYKEYEEVVVEHRAMKERARLKAEQEERERKAAIKVSLKNHHNKRVPSLLPAPWPYAIAGMFHKVCFLLFIPPSVSVTQR